MTCLARGVASAICFILITIAEGAYADCRWAFPVGVSDDSPAPLGDHHPVGGNNLPEYGVHLGADFWSGSGCTDLGQPVYAVADGEVVEVVDSLGSYLDVVVIRHEAHGLGNVYSMYGHIARDPSVTEGTMVSRRQLIGSIDNVLAYFSPCHLHFEILSESAFMNGPFCNGCAAAGYHVSPGYDQKKGVTEGTDSVTGDRYLEVNDAVADNRWYFVDEFLQARLAISCGSCGDGTCDSGESYGSCPQDCDPCQLIGPEGGILDEAGPCFRSGGDPQYWRTENDGYDASLMWTHTTSSTQVDNFGEWELAFAEPGLYRLEAYTDGDFAQSRLATYQVVHGGETEAVIVDQQAVDGWNGVGTFAFEAGGQQSVRLDDNTGEPLSDQVQIVFDALRLTRLDAPDGGGGAGGADAAADAPVQEAGGDATSAVDAGGGAAGAGGGGAAGSVSPQGGGEADGCACMQGSSRSSAPWALVIALLAGAIWRLKRY